MEKLVSPCTSVCRISVETGLCEGCFRTRDEISCWRNLDYEDQKKILAQLKERRGVIRRVAQRRTR